MEQNNKEPRQYTGTKGLSWAIVIGVMGWVLVFNRRTQKSEDKADAKPEKPERKDNINDETPSE